MVPTVTIFFLLRLIGPTRDNRNHDGYEKCLGLLGLHLVTRATCLSRDMSSGQSKKKSFYSTVKTKRASQAQTKFIQACCLAGKAWSCSQTYINSEKLIRNGHRCADLVSISIPPSCNLLGSYAWPTTWVHQKTPHERTHIWCATQSDTHNASQWVSQSHRWYMVAVVSCRQVGNGTPCLAAPSASRLL